MVVYFNSVVLLLILECFVYNLFSSVLVSSPQYIAGGVKQHIQDHIFAATYQMVQVVWKLEEQIFSWFGLNAPILKIYC